MSFLPSNSYTLTQATKVYNKNLYTVYMSGGSRLQGGSYDEKIATFEISESRFENFLIEYCLFCNYQDKYLEEFTLYSKEITPSIFDNGGPWSWLYRLPVETQDWPMHFDENSKDYKLMRMNKAIMKYYDNIGQKFTVDVDEDLIINHIIKTLPNLDFKSIVHDTSTLIEKLYISDNLQEIPLAPSLSSSTSKMKV